MRAYAQGESTLRLGQGGSGAGNVGLGFRILLMAAAVAIGWGGFWLIVSHRSLGTAQSAFDAGDSWAVRALARRGDHAAQGFVGVMFEEGQGAPRDYSIAAAWYLKGARGGDLLSQRRLGLCYLEGRGVKRDADEAARWLERAAGRGDVTSQVRLAQLLAPSDPAASAHWYRAAADRGSAEAQYALALAYHEGAGVPRDEIRSQMYAILAAAGGYAPAIRDRCTLFEASGLTPDQARLAEKMAASWKPFPQGADGASR